MVCIKPADRARSPAKPLLIAVVVLQAVAAARKRGTFYFYQESRMSPFSRLVAVAILLAIATGQARGGPASGERVLHFPPDRCLGRLELYHGPVTNPDELPGKHEWGDWEFFHEARGDVTIPTGEIVRLKVSSPGTVRDLSPLRRLGPNDLYSLVIDGYQGRIPTNPDQTVMPQLSGLTGLKELSIFLVNVSGKGLRHLDHLDSLRSLQIYYTNQSLDAGLPHLARLKSLEYLDLDGGCSDTGLRGLAGATRLRTLVLGVKGIEGPGLMHLEKLPALRSLTLVGQEFSDKRLGYIRNLRSLTRLHFFNSQGDWEVSDAGLVHLSGLTALEELQFTNVKSITDAGLVHLKPLGSLRKLEMERAQITDAGLAQLGEMKSLESLRLGGGFTDAGLASLAKSLKLKKLHVGGTQITDEGARHLAMISSLEHLFLTAPAVTDAGMDSVAQLANLQNLHLYSVRLTDQGLARLAALESLRSLSLGNVKIPLSGLSHLNALSHLTYLHLRDVQQDNTGMNLSGLTRLEDLRIYMDKESQLGDQDMACLAGHTNLRNLQLVRVGGMAIGDQGLKHLAGLTNLDTLVIGSKLTDDGLGYLEGMKKLHALTIYGDFTDQGLRHLEGLKGLSIVRIKSERPLSRAAQNRLQDSLPNLYSFEAIKEPAKKRDRTKGRQ
jgi:hypothetical protein